MESTMDNLDLNSDDSDEESESEDNSSEDGLFDMEDDGSDLLLDYNSISDDENGSQRKKQKIEHSEGSLVRTSSLELVPEADVEFELDLNAPDIKLSDASTIASESAHKSPEESAMISVARQVVDLTGDTPVVPFSPLHLEFQKIKPTSYRRRTYEELQEARRVHKEAHRQKLAQQNAKRKSRREKRKRKAERKSRRVRKAAQKEETTSELGEHKRKREESKESKKEKQKTNKEKNTQNQSNHKYFTEAELLSMEDPELDTKRDLASCAAGHVVLLDLDNWLGFFKKLQHDVPPYVHFLVFFGGTSTPIVPKSKWVQKLVDSKRVKFSRSGKRKDAADFAICHKAGALDSKIPSHIPFTLFSGDRGFETLREHFKFNGNRRVTLFDPHSNPDPIKKLMSVLERHNANSKSNKPDVSNATPTASSKAAVVDLTL